jgi:hypothetical protein
VRSGAPCTGPLLETSECWARPCAKIDCILSGWGPWSECSGMNAVQSYRDRSVKAHASGNGTRCTDSMVETKSCPRPEKEDCKVSQWSAWAECDAKCDGGQTFRKRKIKTPAKHGGSCAEVALEQTKECNTGGCGPAPLNCKLTVWTDWGSCDVDCGTGSKTRSRRVDHLADEGGVGCLGPLEEMLPCTGSDGECSKDRDCKWRQWDAWSACSCSCGSGTRHRNRVVKQAPRGKGKLCEALAKSEVGACNPWPCNAVPTPGKWGAWQSWSHCSQSCGVAYRHRKRSVATHPIGSAEPLAGLTTQFHSCDWIGPCQQDRDCEIDQWSAWSDCSCSCFGIRERSRVISTFVQGNGKPCEGDVLKQVSPCNDKRERGLCGNTKEDCVLSDWVEWGECSRTCSGGQREKTRFVQTPSAGGGKPCDDASLRVVAPCNEEACQREVCEDCKMSHWSSWSACFGSGTIGQKIRHRGIDEMPNYCGKPCDLKSAREVTPCKKDGPPPLVCKWSGWSKGTCGRHSCGSLTSLQSRVLGFHKIDPESLAELGSEDANAKAFFYRLRERMHGYTAQLDKL